MNEKNQPLVTNEPLKFEMDEFQDFKKITDQYRGIYIVILILMKKNQKITHNIIQIHNNILWNWQYSTE